MKELIDILIKVLNEEIDVYSELLKKLQEKTDILISGDLKALDNITKEEYSIIEKLSKFETLREKVIFNIAHKEGLKKDINIKEIIDILQGKEKERLSNSREKLIKLLDEVKNKNELNGTLIKDSLDYIDLNINVFTNRDNNLTYGKGKAKSENISLFNQKA
ncbi:MAG: flagellar protein FlgN [Senegalia sp. (in: firmicutes)]|uniref:flagellar protein FlgN n=1 Tax=Senegalia sp. (in: firmicutes) TaxID=1924098 RepID=UPI003F9A58EE